MPPRKDDAAGSNHDPHRVSRGETSPEKQVDDAQPRTAPKKDHADPELNDPTHTPLVDEADREQQRQLETGEENPV